MCDIHKAYIRQQNVDEMLVEGVIGFLNVNMNVGKPDKSMPGLRTQLLEGNEKGVKIFWYNQQFNK